MLHTTGVSAGRLLMLPQLAASKIITNTVDRTAELSKQGRRAEVGVLLGCDTIQRARLRVTLAQHSGALAQGRRRAACRPSGSGSA